MSAPQPAQEPIRAWRQSLLWLLRCLYVARVGLCYFVMVHGRHARPDLLHALFSAALVINLTVFLAAFFEYFHMGARSVRLDSWTRPLLFVATWLAAHLWLPAPDQAMGWSRGATPAVLWGVEFALLPLITLRLQRAIGSRPGVASTGGPARPGGS